MEYYPIKDVSVFTARVSKTRTKISGKPYESYRITLPKKIAEKMSVSDGDYLLVIAKKASWYHLLEWESEYFKMLPENVRLELSVLDALQSQGTVFVQIALPTPLSNITSGFGAGGAYDRNFSGAI